MTHGLSEQKRAGFESGSQSVSRDELPRPDKNSTRVMVRLGPAGRVVIPSEMREAMNLKQGDGMLATLEPNGELRLAPLADKVRELHAITAKYHPEGVSLVDEFLAEKYAEVAREAERDREND